MSIAVSVFDEGDSTTDATSFATNSVTPVAGNLYHLVIGATQAASASIADPTVTGCSLTWTKIVSDPATGGGRKLWFYRAMGSPTTGALTISFGATSVDIFWCLLECSGVDTSGSGGSRAIVQSALSSISGSSGTSQQVDLATSTPVDSLDRCIFACLHLANENSTPRTNWTELSDRKHATLNANMEVQWRSDAFEATGSATWTTSQTRRAIMAELRAAPTTQVFVDVVPI